MTQTVPFDALLGAAKSGMLIGATLYQLDGTTVHAAFSRTGWYESPAGSGGWHHPGLSLPDAGGVVAVGISGTEYIRIAVEAAKLLASSYTAPPTVAAIDTQLSGTHGAGSWATATGFATPTNVTDAQTAVTNAIAALNNLSQAQAQTAAAAAITAAGLPNAAAFVAAVMAQMVTGTKTVEDVLRNLWSVNVGDSEADDPDDPTTIAYKDASGNVDVTHTLTDTTRVQT